jgi:hypothetical protein
VFFEGNYQEYEADRKRRLGAEASQPHRIKYRQGAEALGPALQEQHVAHPQRQPAEPGGQRVPPPVDRDHRHPEAAPEVQLLDRAPHDGRLRHQDGLDDLDRLVRQVLVAQGQVRLDHQAHPLLDLEQPLPRGLDDQQVPLFELDVRFRVDAAAAAQDGPHLEAHLGEAGVADGLARQRRAGRDHHLREVLPHRVLLGVALLPRVGQQPMADERHIKDAAQRDHRSHRQQLEHGERRQARRFEEAARRHVRGGADQRAGAAQHGGVGQRDEELPRAQPALARHAEDGRHEHGRRRGVVHEGRQERGDRHEREEHLGEAPPGVPVDPLPQEVHDPAFINPEERTKIEARMTTISLANPEKACSTSKMPRSTRAHSSTRVATSTESHSVAKTTTTASSRARTRKIGRVMVLKGSGSQSREVYPGKASGSCTFG